jgi:formylmethanofuran dehydrogenase subunit D
MDISKFIRPPEHEIAIITHCDIFTSAEEVDKFSEEYGRLSLVIAIDSDDMRKVSVKEGENVKIRSKSGWIIAKVNKSESIHPGLAFMPHSFYANSLSDEDGNIVASISRTTERTMDIKETLDRFTKGESERPKGTRPTAEMHR